MAGGVGRGGRKCIFNRRRAAYSGMYRLCFRWGGGPWSDATAAQLVAGGEGPLLVFRTGASYLLDPAATRQDPSASSGRGTGIEQRGKIPGRRAHAGARESLHELQSVGVRLPDYRHTPEYLSHSSPVMRMIFFAVGWTVRPPHREASRALFACRAARQTSRLSRRNIDNQPVNPGPWRVGRSRRREISFG